MNLLLSVVMGIFLLLYPKYKFFIFVINNFNYNLFNYLLIEIARKFPKYLKHLQLAYGHYLICIKK